MRLYGELADWYTLLTPLSEYAEEAEAHLALLQAELGPGRHHLLELGASAGHVAWHLRGAFALTLTDLSPAMAELARATCPEAEVLVGDMRTMRLDRRFDAVFLHDAVSYIIGEADLAAVFETAAAHLRPGGLFVVMPDYVTETFAPEEESGGSDGEGRALRYLAWAWRRDGESDRYVVDYALMTRVGDGPTEVHTDRHEEGLFPRATWLRLLDAAGFDAQARTRHDDWAARDLDVFVARRR